MTDTYYMGAHRVSPSPTGDSLWADLAPDKRQCAPYQRAIEGESYCPEDKPGVTSTAPTTTKRARPNA